MNTDRERAILEILLKEKQIRVKDLAKQLYASEPSIRRDLASLEKQHLIKRVYGGAVLEENGISMIKIPFTIRELEQSREKVLIARSLCEQAHLYVWDEPLNFIDIYSRMQIERLILEMRPTLLLVEHDRTFTERIGARIVELGEREAAGS